IDWNVYYYGSYGPSELKLIHNVLRQYPDPIMVDVGANVGHHTLACAAFCREITAFEPYPPVAAKLREKVESNRLANVRIHQVGLSDRDQVLAYDEPISGNTGTGGFISTGEAAANVLRLPLVVGDDYLARCGILRVDFIKIDVEGHERAAI